MAEEESGSTQTQFEIHEHLASIYAKQQLFEKAFAHYQAFHKLKEEVFNDKSDARVKNLEVVHQTEQARREATLLQSQNEALAQEIDERKRVEKALVQAKEQAEVANRAKSQFLSSMSHELRTPLNGILGYAQILERDSSLSSKQRQGVGVIRQSGEHLLTLISDVLDIAKIEAQKLELTPTAVLLQPFLQEIAGLIRLQAENKGLHFAFQLASGLPTAVLADEKRLRQILLNLLSNAVKFTSVGTVSFAVSCQGEKLQFHVADSGMGIAAADQGRIFQPFEQVGAQQSRAQGTGLGLSISQQLAQAMGGHIRVASTLGMGSDFRFEVLLPTVAETAVLPDISATIVDYAGRRRRVLVIDDNAVNRDVLVALLQAVGLETAVASDGKEGLAQAQSYQPDLILLDLVLPDLTTEKIVSQLQQLEMCATIPVVGVSADLMSKWTEQFADFGLVAFLPKPIQTSDLYHILANTLQLAWQIEPKEATVRSSVLPKKEALERLLAHAQMGDLVAVRQMVQAMVADNEQLQPFAARVTVLTANFDEEGLLSLLTNEPR